MLNIVMNISIVLFILICLALILVILIQKGRGGGLASAFGGGGGGNTAFGAKTGDVLTWVTSVVFGLFLLLAIALNLMADTQNQRLITPVQEEAPPTLPIAIAEPTTPAQPQPPEAGEVPATQTPDPVAVPAEQAPEAPAPAATEVPAAQP